MTLLEKEKEPPLVRLRRGLGSPWTGLGIYGVGTLIKGLFYLPMLGNPSRLPAVEQWGGPNLWAFVWIIVGAFAICAVLTRRCGAIAAGGLFFIYLIWGGMYLIAEVYGNYPLGSMASVVYLLVAATIFWAFSRPRWSRSSSNQRTARVREIPNERKPSRGRRRSGGPRRCRADRIYHRPIR